MMNKPLEDFKIALLDTKKYKEFFELLDSNREALEDFFAGTIAQTTTLEATKNYCGVIEERINNKSYFPFIISDPVSDKFIGLVDVKNIDWNIPKAELGYFVDASYGGKGISTRAVNDVIERIVKEHKFKKLLCRISAKNIASIKVAEKNNFELEGTIRRDYKTTRGEVVDLNYYGRLF